jgi:hypothetical protein
LAASFVVFLNCYFPEIDWFEDGELEPHQLVVASLLIMLNKRAVQEFSGEDPTDLMGRCNKGRG